MKKIFVSFALLLLIVVTAQAQSPRFGVRAGANYSGISGDNVDDLDMVYGFHAGVTSQFFVTPDSFFSIQPEILFSQKGAEQEEDDFRLKLSYIDIPVLARINAGPFYFEGGPQISARIGDDIRSDRDDAIHIYDREIIRRTSFGYVAGVGLATTKLGLSIGVRYNGEISNINNNDNIPNIRSNVFMLTLSYLLPGKQELP